VPAVWVLDVAGRALHVHRQPSAGGYAEVDAARKPRTRALPAAAIDLTGLLG
jgi:hypothetical protein